MKRFLNLFGIKLKPTGDGLNPYGRRSINL